jgi:glycosyltransferase involved in cell wall biosynthesis
LIRIAIVSNYAFTTWNFRRNLLEALLAYGVEVHVVAPYDDKVPLIEGLDARFHALTHMHPQGIAPMSDQRLKGELKRIFGQIKPDLILLYTIKPNLYGNMAAKSLGIPTISFVTGLGYTFLHSKTMRWLVGRMYRNAFDQTRCAVFHNADDADLFLASQYITPKQSQVIPGSGVNTRHFAYQPRSETYNRPFVFLLAARLVRDKGLMEYIEAARTLKKAGISVICRVIGDWVRVNPSVVERKLFDEAVAAGIIEYGGMQNDVRPDMYTADTLVLPSYREGLSKTLIEALATGLPIITTDTPGCRELVPDRKTGFLVPIQDAIALADAMQKMIQLSHSQRIAMGQSGRALVEQQYADTVILEQYFQLVISQLPKP